MQRKLGLILIAVCIVCIIGLIHETANAHNWSKEYEEELLIPCVGRGSFYIMMDAHSHGSNRDDAVEEVIDNLQTAYDSMSQIVESTEFTWRDLYGYILIAEPDACQ